MKRLDPRVAIGLLVLALGLAVAATQLGFLQGARPGARRLSRPAPELVGIRSWVNSDPLTVASLRGKVVLVDFWTYTCINCIRTFPHLRALYARYRPAGLEILGVHSPEFSFEKVRANVEAAVRRNRLPYPVALDSEMETWRAYGAQFWPQTFFVDHRGVIRYLHVGEGDEREIEEQVRTLLRAAGSRVPPPLDVEGTRVDPRITPEIYAGRLRGGAFLGNDEGYRDGAVVYAPTDERARAAAGTGGTFFLEGEWSADGESVRAAREGATVRLRFFARDVFMVAAPCDGRTGVRVLLDGRAPPPGSVGDDVRDGLVTVDRCDLFRLVRLSRPERHELTLVAARGFRLYTFTFG